MSQIGSTEALEKYLSLERDNKILREENRVYYAEIQKLRKQWSDIAGKVNILFNWLETRKDTKTETVQRKMAEIFKFAYMEAQFEDMRDKWPNPEAKEYAAKMYPNKP
jgi:predicted nuclease with TOPRIM domain